MKRIRHVFYAFVLFFSLQSVNAENNHTLSVTDSIRSKEYVSLALKKMENNIKELYDEVEGEYYDLNYEAFRYAYIGYQSLKNQQRLNEKEILSIIDFSKDSNTKRFYTIDLEEKQIIFHTYVSHGKKSGDKLSTSFSNTKESNKSSIGFFITGSTYMGSKGFSLRLHGDEKGYNSNVATRGVVIHTADYVSEDYIRRNGRLGRSLGCPVLPEHIYKDVIETIKDKTVVFAYYNDKKYLKSSKYLNLLKLIDYTVF
ncbi:murein L,D-transpeptidase catalytic domain family protein [Capnocytophaga canis]|uniref:L,D-transpeptidase catalytic domain protein n=1 Tax=Capnocytophaga canis TaxID=1848903 RepID=A0A3A1YJG6_9FLAO|nr:murein L,D-transpeptidase catalytic domain family protein [Capnocytophaga canis]RIY37200.1 L,D-transpeptidase catalytic domain protein [Capnocytophaga canis]